MKQPTPGTILYYTQGYEVKSAIYCAQAFDKDFAVVYPLQETNVIKDEANREHYACNRIRFNELYSTPAEAMDAVVNHIRQKLEASVSTFSSEATSDQNPRKGTAQAQQDQLNTLDALMIDPDGPRVRRAYACIAVKGKQNLYMAYLTPTDHLGFRIYQPESKAGTHMPDWQLTEDIHVAQIRAVIWSPSILPAWMPTEQQELPLE